MSNLYTPKQIRQVFSSDAAQLAQIHHACLPTSWSEQEFCELLTNQNNFCYALETNHQIVGFILCNQILDECEILTLAVLASHRRQNIAKQLIEKTYQHAKAQKVKNIFLEVAENNYAAQNLYKTSGFIQIGLRKNYYIIDNQPIAALIMRYDV